MCIVGLATKKSKIYLRPDPSPRVCKAIVQEASTANTAMILFYSERCFEMFPNERWRSKAANYENSRRGFD
jgi:hypothetical protein